MKHLLSALLISFATAVSAAEVTVSVDVYSLSKDNFVKFFAENPFKNLDAAADTLKGLSTSVSSISASGKSGFRFAGEANGMKLDVEASLSPDKSVASVTAQITSPNFEMIAQTLALPGALFLLGTRERADTMYIALARTAVRSD